MSKERQFQRLNDDDGWDDVKMADLRMNDTFRMLDDGVLRRRHGKTEFVASSDPYKGKDGVLTINIEA